MLLIHQYQAPVNGRVGGYTDSDGVLYVEPTTPLFSVDGYSEESLAVQAVASFAEWAQDWEVDPDSGDVVAESRPGLSLHLTHSTEGRLDLRSYAHLLPEAEKEKFASEDFVAPDYDDMSEERSGSLSQEIARAIEARVEALISDLVTNPPTTEGELRQRFRQHNLV